MRKICSLIIMMTLIINTSFTVEAASETNPFKQVNAPYVNARCAIALDSKSKIVLYEQNAYMVVPMASTTKILTALVALKYGDLDKKVEISSRAAGIRGSTVGYKKGEQISIRELVYGLMLRSGNDAAIALAEGIAGSVDEFMKLMNEYAISLGLVNTHFESPHGLDSENHYTTAYDLALITAKAKEVEEFNKIVSSKDINSNDSGFSRSFHNINKILWHIPNSNGVKTGYTGKAGKCLVTSIVHEGNDVIVVVLNSPGRWGETKKIYDYVSQEYEYKKVASKDEILLTSILNKGRDRVVLKSKEDIIIPTKKSAILNKKVIAPNNLKVSVKKGEQLGLLQVYEDNTLIFEEVLSADNSIIKQNIFKRWFISLIR
jgi:serine-type D-Ala-D-Ala carboxypeptidase (penicillin-binding protein 5/6)